MNDAHAQAADVTYDTARFLGIVSAAIKSQRLMDSAALLSDLALDEALAGRAENANAFSIEAARMRREAERQWPLT